MLALTTAAQRGVDVTLINSAASDQGLTYHAQGSYYTELLAAGVKICLYPTPILLHAKTIWVDDDIAVIGSSNLDHRSLQLSHEVSTVVPDRTVVADLKRVEAQYRRLQDSRTSAVWWPRLHSRSPSPRPSHGGI